MSSQVTVLENGLRVTTDKIEGVESVFMCIWVNVGSRNEKIKENGISHFLEHMAFKGTEKRNAKQIAEEFDNIGASINAFTSTSNTVYHAKVLKEYTETSFEILADMIQNSSFDEEEIERERQVILQEISMTNDTPDDIIFDYYDSVAFPNQALGRPILGPEKNVKKLQREDFKKYIDKNYTANKIVVSMSGNIEHSRALELVNKYVTKIKSSKEIKKEAGVYAGGSFRKNKKLEQTHCILGFNGESTKSENKYTASILGSILGGGMSSRLFQEIREKRGLCYTVYSYSHSYEDCGTFKIYSATSPDKINDFIKATVAELKNSKNSITEDELNRTKAQFKSGLLMSQESVSGRGKSIASDLVNFNRIISNSEILDKINSVNVKSVQELLTHMIDTNPTLVLLGNIKNSMNYEEYLNELKTI